MKVFAGSVYAISKANVIRSAALVITANSEEEALGFAHKGLEKECPSSDGWMNHTVYVTEVLAEIIELVYDSIKKNK